MGNFAGQKVPLVSDADKRSAFEGDHQLTGFSVDNTERELFLKGAFRTGDTTTVWLDPIQAGYLFWHLKRLLQDRKESEGSPVKFATDVGEQTFGWLFPPGE